MVQSLVHVGEGVYLGEGFGLPLGVRLKSEF